MSPVLQQAPDGSWVEATPAPTPWGVRAGEWWARMRWRLPRLRWEATYPTDRYIGVAWGPQVHSDTYALGVGLGRRQLTVEVPHMAVHLAREGLTGRTAQRRRDRRLRALAAALVTPERYTTAPPCPVCGVRGCLVVDEVARWRAMREWAPYRPPLTLDSVRLITGPVL